MKTIRVDDRLMVNEPSGIDPVAPFPFFITNDALTMLLMTVGTKPPETGGKCFGPVEKFGVDVFEFDINGSQGNMMTVYRPDDQWSNRRHDFWLSQPEGGKKLWVADVHSHPGDFIYPSQKGGTGIGDLGYVEEIFQQNTWMKYFFLPIVTSPGTEKVTITPWLLSNENPHEPLLAHFQICKESEFPERIFPPLK